jgi:predicted ATP-binding protein involved in virulence
MLTLVGDLARRAATLNPHMGAEAAHRTSGVVLIDELDLHLHPRWQRHVIRDLKRTFPALQFVVTTHSPQLIGEALPSEIRVLEDNRTTTPPRSFGVDSNRVLQELMGAPSRDESMANLLSDLFQAIEEENYADSERLLAQTEATLGSDDPEVTRARALMSFLELSR